jgi:NAD(P)-dependent dehydrogenase (short-subunit alcohol dehydrogenase family)
MREVKAMRFDDKTAIVTGGASGIGLATALRLGREGARVVIAGHNEQKAQRAADEVRAAGAPEVIAIACDVAVEADIVRTVDTTILRFGRLDIVVNNAGVMIFKPIEAHTEADLIGVLQVDFFGAFWFTKQVFLKCQPGASVVNVASIHAVETTPLVSAYAAAKAALVSFTRSAAIEGKSRGIRVNVVLPGAIETPMLRQNPNIASGAEVLDENDVGKPEDVAAAIAFLAADEAAFITGTELRVDGGRLARL